MVHLRGSSGCTCGAACGAADCLLAMGVFSHACTATEIACCAIWCCVHHVVRARQRQRCRAQCLPVNVCQRGHKPRSILLIAILWQIFIIASKAAQICCAFVDGCRHPLLPVCSLVRQLRSSKRMTQLPIMHPKQVSEPPATSLLACTVFACMHVGLAGCRPQTCCKAWHEHAHRVGNGARVPEVLELASQLRHTQVIKILLQRGIIAICSDNHLNHHRLHHKAYRRAIKMPAEPAQTICCGSFRCMQPRQKSKRMLQTWVGGRSSRWPVRRRKSSVLSMYLAPVFKMSARPLGSSTWQTTDSKP